MPGRGILMPACHMQGGQLAKLAIENQGLTIGNRSGLQPLRFMGLALSLRRW
jgi:hypothetical protein